MLATKSKGVPLLVTTACCQIVLLYGLVNQVIANVHFDWKGLLNKIIVSAINIMINDYKCKPSNIIACIAPSISNCCFEVDEVLMFQFKSSFSNID